MWKGVVSTLMLFTSFSTLLCCALPALLVTLGMGAAFAGLVSAVPQLVWLSEHKGAVFLFAGGMLTVAGGLRWQSRNAPCPADPRKAAACRRVRAWSGVVYWSSVAIYATGFFFAYLAVYLL